MEDQFYTAGKDSAHVTSGAAGLDPSCRDVMIPLQETLLGTQIVRVRERSAFL